MHFFSNKIRHKRALKTHWLHKTRRSESVFEVIIAITVMSIGITAVTLLITTVMRAGALSKEFIIANNLAAEGLEAVSNVRESNWIEFPGYEEDCWNVVATVTTVNDAGDCQGSSTKIGATYGSGTSARYFIPEISPDYGWVLTQVQNMLTTDLSNTTRDNYYDLWIDPSTGIYATSSGTTDTPYYRMVIIQYYNSSDTKVSPTSTSAVYMNVTSIVEWKDKLQKVHSVKKMIRLFNYVSA